MKHAIMILAHNNFSVVDALLEQFDAPEFDIYIHINAKVKGYPKERWESHVSRAGLHFVPRIKVGYCDYSMVRAVMSLFQTALQTHHDYYHLISGADLCVKKADEFMSFFEANAGKEFVGFSKSFSEKRVFYRNFLVASCRSSNPFIAKQCTRTRKLLLIIQQKLGLRKKIRNFVEVKKGCDWYSVTEAALRYMVSKEKEFQKDFKRSYCPTEFFAQTVLYNSGYKDKLYLPTDCESSQCVRTIDWERGEPYVFRNEDFEFLISSRGMFARKFDENTDMEVVNRLKKYVKG